MVCKAHPLSLLSLEKFDPTENCTMTNDTSCVRINGNLLVYLDLTPSNVSYVEPDYTISIIRQTDDDNAVSLTPTSASSTMTYGLIRGGVVLGLLGMMLMFVRKRQLSKVYIDDTSVYGNATPSTILDDIT